MSAGDVMEIVIMIGAVLLLAWIFEPDNNDDNEDGLSPM